MTFVGQWFKLDIMLGEETQTQKDKYIFCWVWIVNFNPYMCICMCMSVTVDYEIRKGTLSGEKEVLKGSKTIKEVYWLA